MRKIDLQKLLDNERLRNERLKTVNNIAINALNDLSTGLGRKRNNIWSAQYLAADELAKIAKLSNQ